MSKQIEEEGLNCAYLLGKSDGYKQGRADAIDEILTQLTEIYFDDDKLDVLYLRTYLEQLKEQNK